MANTGRHRTFPRTYPRSKYLFVANGFIWECTCLLVTLNTNSRGNHCPTTARMARVSYGLHCNAHCVPTEFLLFDDFYQEQKVLIGQPGLSLFKDRGLNKLSISFPSTMSPDFSLAT